MTDELLASVSDGHGSTIIHVDDVGEVAAELAEHLEAELVEGDHGFAEAVSRRRAAAAERAAAHAALVLSARDARAAEPVVVTDVAGLRSLIGRIADADRLVEAAREDARVRAGRADGLTVHPTAIRDAAADVLDARTAVAECERDVDRLVAEGESDGPAAPSGASEPTDHHHRRGALRITDRDEVIEVGLRAIAALVIAVLVLVLTGSPVALVLPAVAVCWGVVVVVRQRDSAYDAAIASRNLQNMARLADRAYGGAGLLDPSESPARRTERLEAQRALAAARDRLTYSEASWRALVGPDADVDDVESVVRVRDAQHGASDAVIAELPSNRTAEAHRRRLLARWKLAWWVLDRPIPALGDAMAAVDALAEEGIDRIEVPSGGLSDEERSQLEQLSAGRTDDELRAVESRRLAVVVVADEDASIDEDRLQRETAQLPADVRFVVVAPTR